MINRRKFLQRTTAVGAGLTVLSSGLIAGSSLTKGNKDSHSFDSTSNSFKKDLTINPLDETITITGKIFDHDRKYELGNAIIDICHCDARGNFKRFGKFVFKGRVKTNDSGIYLIKTNVPGKYVEDGITKSKRIFVKVSAQGYKEQFSTLYLDSNNYPFIDGDHFQTSRLIDNCDLPEKVGHGKNSTIRYNHYLV